MWLDILGRNSKECWTDYDNTRDYPTIDVECVSEVNLSCFMWSNAMLVYVRKRLRESEDEMLSMLSSLASASIDLVCPGDPGELESHYSTEVLPTLHFLP